MSTFLVPRRGSFVFFSLSIAIIILSSFSPQTNVKVKAQNNPPSCPTCSQDTQRIIYAPTIDMPETESSDIVLNCRSIHVMQAIPTFYTADGEAIVGDVITLQPSEIRFEALESLIPPAHRGQHIWGGMSISYTGKLMEVWAQITTRGQGQHGSSDVVFSVLNNFGADTQDAVWWMPPAGNAVIALGNSSASPIHSAMKFSNGDIEELDIAPYATKYVRRSFTATRSTVLGEGESVRIITNGPAGSLKAVGYVISSTSDFTSSIRFYETPNSDQANLYAIDFKVKNSTAHLILENTSGNSITAEPRFLPRSGNGQPVELASIILSPGEIRELSLKLLYSAARNRPDLDIVSVQVWDNGLPGSLIGSLNTQDQATGIGYDVPLRDSGPWRNSTGAYPWRLDDDFQTTVAITNVGSERTQFNGVILFSGGEYFLGQRELMAGQTATFDLRKLRDQQTPDVNGNVIPITATGGQFRWSLARTSASESHLIGRSEVVSRSEHISISYSCAECCPETGPYWYFDQSIYAINTGDTVQKSIVAYWEDCYGYLYWDYYPGWAFDSLDTDDHNIATIANLTDRLEVHGVNGGNTNWTGYYYFQNFEGAEPFCYDESYYTSTGGEIDVYTRIQNLQYKDPGTTNYIDISGTIYVLKGTTVEFKAIPNPNDASFRSGTPSWSGSSGIIGTGQIKTATFNTVSSNLTDYKTVVATSTNSVTVNVIVYELTGTLNPQDYFNGRSTTRYGLSEKVNLGIIVTPNVSTQQMGGLTWVVVTGSGTISPGADGSGTYTAPGIASSETLKLEVVNGPSKGEGTSYTKDVVAPNGAVARQTPLTSVGHTLGNCSVGFSLEPYLLPTDVSFQQLGFMEGTVPAVTTPQLTGYYWDREGESHNISGPTVIDHCDVILGCKADFTDLVQTDDTRTPCSTGDFTWNIPWQYVVGANIPGAVTFFTAVHYQYNTPPDKVSIQKAGVGPFTKAISDSTTTVFP